MKVLFTAVIFFLVCASYAENSPLCEDLARFACAPGSYKDGTGEVRSETQVQKQLTEYADKASAEVEKQFREAINKPENAHFKETAIASLGLQNAPICNSTNSEDTTQCEENLIEGLTRIVQKQALSRLLPQTGLERTGNLRDLAYVINSDVYLQILNGLNKKVEQDLGSPERAQKIENEILPQVKKLIIKKLQALPIEEKHRKLMIDKINAIKFDGTNCSRTSDHEHGTTGDMVSSLVISNAFYQPVRNKFRICAGYLLQSTSEFQLIETMTHELTHSIDQCRIATGPADWKFKYKNKNDLRAMEKEYPIPHIIQCLRDERSIHAKNIHDPDNPTIVNPYAQYLSGDEDAPQQGYPMGVMGNYNMSYGVGGQQVKEYSFCDKQDQIGESFCDWMAAEVLPEYIESNFKLTTDQYRNGYANARRNICSIKNRGQTKFRTHPAMEDRINRLLLVNPKIRAHMGCPEKHPKFVYCDPNNPIELLPQKRPTVPTFPNPYQTPSPAPTPGGDD